MKWVPGRGMLSLVEKGKILLLDPATGKKEELLALADVKPRRPADSKLDPRAIGRQSPRTYMWSPDGKKILLHRHGNLFVFDTAANNLPLDEIAAKVVAQLPQNTSSRRTSGWQENQGSWCKPGASRRVGERETVMMSDSSEKPLVNLHCVLTT